MEGVLVPIVRIDVQSGKSTEYKRAILRGVRSAITTSLGVGDDRVMQRIIEVPADDIDITENRSDALAVIEISMLPGRGPDLKGALYESIVGNLSADPCIHARDIMVIVNEPSAECFAIGGVMQCTLSGEPWPDEDEDETLAPAEEPAAALEDSEPAPTDGSGSAPADDTEAAPAEEPEA
jgi:phenylpyruvate tautomerase PptA (4-oxalocrotonate tautomerase family)